MGTDKRVRWVQIRELDTDRGEYTVVPVGSMKAYKGSIGLAPRINL